MTSLQKGSIRRMAKYHIREKGAPLLLGLLFLLGAALGTQLYPSSSEENVELLSALLDLQQDSTLLEVIQSSLFSEGVCLTLLFFCGFCAIGQPIAAFLLFYRGLGLGMTGAYLAQQGREAFTYYSLILLPQTLLFLLLQIAASREAIAFSLNFLRQLLGGGSRTFSTTARVYILRFVLLLFLMVVAAAAGAFLQLFVSKWIL